MNKVVGILTSTLLILFITASNANAGDYQHEESHPERIFINVAVSSAGVGVHGLAEFVISHIPDEGQSPMFVDGKTYYATEIANDNMLALAVWSYTHNQMLKVQLDPNATGDYAKIYQMRLGGPLN